MLLRPGVSAAALAVLLAAAGAAQAADQSVTANSSNEFVPSEVTINQGEKVTWVNVGGVHNVRFDDGLFEQPANAIAPPWPLVERRFDLPGDYGYLCVEHGASMSGEVHVLAAGAPPGGAPPGGGPPGGAPPGGGPPGGGPGAPVPGGPPSLPLLKVILNVSDATPAAGKRVRLFGVVRPARDGRKVQIQRRRRSGAFRTIATTRLRDAGAAKSEFSVQLRVSADAVLRARVAGDDERATGLSSTRRLDVRG